MSNGGKLTVAHTPGPWMVESDPSHFGTMTTIVGGGSLDKLLPREMMVQVGGYAHPQTAEANARLIAAAPELLEALRQMLVNSEADGKAYRDCHKKARAAIAKATGDPK